MEQFKLNEVRAIEQGGYTLNSYHALESAIEEAQRIYDNPAVSETEINDAVAALEAAKGALRTVAGMRVLTIPVTEQGGTAAPTNTQFIRYDVKYNVSNTIYANDGQIVWTVGAYDGGDYEFYLPDDESRGIISTVNGQPVAESGRIVFTLEEADAPSEADKTQLQAAMEEAGSSECTGGSKNR